MAALAEGIRGSSVEVMTMTTSAISMPTNGAFLRPARYSRLAIMPPAIAPAGPKINRIQPYANENCAAFQPQTRSNIVGSHCHA